jgi:hypothetical protein
VCGYVNTAGWVNLFVIGRYGTREQVIERWDVRCSRSWSASALTQLSQDTRVLAQRVRHGERC